MSGEILRDVVLLREKIKDLEGFNVNQAAEVARLRRNADMAFFEKQNQEEMFSVLQRKLQEAKWEILDKVEQYGALDRKYTFLNGTYTELYEQFGRQLEREKELEVKVKKMTEYYQHLSDKSEKQEAEFGDKLCSMTTENTKLRDLLDQFEKREKELVEKLEKLERSEETVRMACNQLVEGHGSCPICLDNFVEVQRIPKVVGCGHSICVPCLEHLFEDERRTREQATCPLCREEIGPGLAINFPTNFAAQNLGMAGQLGRPL